MVSKGHLSSTLVSSKILSPFCLKVNFDSRSLIGVDVSVVVGSLAFCKSFYGDRNGYVSNTPKRVGRIFLVRFSHFFVSLRIKYMVTKTVPVQTRKYLKSNFVLNFFFQNFKKIFPVCKVVI